MLSLKHLPQNLDAARPWCLIIYMMTTVAVTNELQITLATGDQILSGQLTADQSFDLARQLVHAGIQRTLEEGAAEYFERQDIQSHA